MDVWEYGCLRIEPRSQQGDHRLDDAICRVIIRARDDEGAPAAITIEGPLGVQLVQLLHGCVVLCGSDDQEWRVPNLSRSLHLRRIGADVVLAAYPDPGRAPLWNVDDGIFLVDFALLLQSLSAAAEWALGGLGADYAGDESVRVLVHQWERAWQRFSRLVTFGRLRLEQ
ncbi:MAG TPA: hypothetical protein VER55_08780 [Ardenticatenaceae bacterium]|nr:hypothetical protein [Ardenticatenaceae bacterium]